MSNPNEPPPPNPILSAFETFQRETPLVTRYTITTITISFIASFFFDPSFALNCIPYFTIFKFEVYRILTSPLVCQNLLSLVFAYISFVDNAKRLEFSMGSTAFLWLMMTLAFCTNILFLGICFTLYGMTGEQAYLYMQSSSIWIILFGLISIECSKAPAGSKRKLFFCDVPTLYYPLGLLTIFNVLGGFSLALTISTAVGYAYGKGHLDRMKLSESRLKRWEQDGGVLANFSRRPGWVVGTAATGSEAWNNTSSSQGGGFSMFQRQGGGASRGGGLSAPGPASAPPEAARPAGGGFPKGGGRTLGSGPSRRPPSAEARAAMLEAASKRAASGEENV